PTQASSHGHDLSHGTGDVHPYRPGAFHSYADIRTVIASRACGERQLAELLGTRLASRSGGAIAYVPTRTAD
ncbi:hypothetical protein ACIQ65_33620, partial [Streptomyces griseofuscus]